MKVEFCADTGADVSVMGVSLFHKSCLDRHTSLIKLTEEVKGVMEELYITLGCSTPNWISME